MKDYHHLERLTDISNNYDVLLIDLWGVIHNGIRVFKNVSNVLKGLKKQNKSVFFITNAPRRSEVIQQQLKEFGIISDLYNKVISSGELSWLHMKKNYKNKKCFMIGPPRDNHLIEGLDLNVVNEDSFVDIILNTGPWGDQDRLENYTDLLRNLVSMKPTMICSNPDKLVVRGEKFMICAGLLAEFYEKIGGKVEYFGKPFKEIY